VGTTVFRNLHTVAQNALISGFHRVLLQSITFISRLMHKIIQNLEVKIYVVQKFCIIVCISRLIKVIDRTRSFDTRGNVILLTTLNLKIKIYRAIIWPAVLYGCETWSLTLREERMLRAFENRVLRRKLGPKRD
jgi:hypothetical protein